MSIIFGGLDALFKKYGSNDNLPGPTKSMDSKIATYAKGIFTFPKKTDF